MSCHLIPCHTVSYHVILARVTLYLTDNTTSCGEFLVQPQIVTIPFRIGNNFSAMKMLNSSDETRKKESLWPQGTAG